MFSILRNLVAISCISLYSLSATASQVSATLDRNNLELNETVTLTLTAESSFNLPDLQSIAEFLQFLNSSQQQRQQIINGSISGSFSIQIDLLAIKAGSFTIPSFQLGSQGSTQPIQVNITASKTNQTLDKSITLSMTVDQKQPHVQQQVIVTTQLFINNQIASRLSGAQISEFNPDGVAITPLSDNRYNKVINGQHYHVIEQKHAIFPQQSGKLLLPSRTFTAAVGFRRQVREISDAIELNVLPASSQDVTWLPAQNVQLSSSNLASQTSIGETLNLTVEITATGLQYSQLPELEIPKIPGAKVYKDKVDTNNNVTENGIVGSKSQTWIIVPNTPGTINLAAIEIPWFNSITGKREIARLPEQKITVTAGNAQPPVINTNPINSVPNSGTTQTIEVQVVPWWSWALIIILSALLALSVIGWYIHVRQLKNNNSDKPIANNQPKLKTLKNELIQACKQNEVSTIKPKFIAWINMQLPNINIVNMTDALDELPRLYTQASAEQVINDFAELNTSLYKQEGVKWQDGAQLAGHIKALVAIDKKHKNKEINLYPKR